MKLVVFCIATALLAQEVGPGLPDQTLPSGKSQRDEILKAEHQKILKDLDRLLKTATELKADLERKDYHVLSVSSLKKTDQIEKLARQIRSRLRQF